MACRERESKNEIAGFGVLKLPIPAISNAAAPEKQNPAQSVRALFTDDFLHLIPLVRCLGELMTHRKHFAEKKLHYAVQLLAGSGDLDARISAVASILIHIEDADVPSSLTADLARLKGLFFDMSSSSNVVFVARGLTEEASRNAAAKVVDLYTALVRL